MKRLKRVEVMRLTRKERIAERVKKHTGRENNKEHALEYKRRHKKISLPIL